MEQDSLYQQVYTDIKGAIGSMADGLGIAAEHVYEVLVKQQVVESIIFLSIILIGIPFLIWGIRGMLKVKEWDGAPDLPSTIAVLLSIIGAILVGVGLGHTDVIMTGLINPEYGAIKEIMSHIK